MSYEQPAQPASEKACRGYREQGLKNKPREAVDFAYLRTHIATCQWSFIGAAINWLSLLRANTRSGRVIVTYYKSPI